MVKTAHPTGRRRIGRAAVAGAALATLGIGAMQTAPAGAAAPTAAPPSLPRRPPPYRGTSSASSRIR